MSEDTTYNGWTNYETWGCALVIDNDQGSHEYVREQLAILRDDGTGKSHRNVPEIWTAEEAVRYEFADFLKDFTEELCGFESELGLPEPSDMAKQLLRGALSDINYEEIAANIINETAEASEAAS